MTDLAHAVGVLDVDDGPYTDWRGAAEVAVFLLMVTAFLVVGGCLL